MVKPKFNKKFFPQKVYRCSCLERVIASCLLNNIYSFIDICVKVNQTTTEKIFCTKCGENKQDIIFTCPDHIPMVILTVEMEQTSDGDTSYYFRDETKSYCPICVKKCLETMYYYFEHVNFKKN